MLTNMGTSGIMDHKANSMQTIRGAEMNRKKSYCFDHPIRIIRPKANGLDVIFYTFLFSALAAIILFLLCMKDGKFGIYLEFPRVLASIPLIIIAYFVLEPLKELRRYIPKLARKETWTIEELMKMTGKDRKQTEQIMTRVLESGFIVDPSCELQV